MFYVKQTFGYAEVITEINDENVYCRCPECGVEHQVDLADIFGNRDIDLFGTSVLCEDCTKKRREGGAAL